MQGLENLEKRPAAAPAPGLPAARSAGSAGSEGLPASKPTDVRWKRALKGVVAAAFRLHHYRFVRTRMLHDALSASRGVTGSGGAPAECRPDNRR